MAGMVLSIPLSVLTSRASWANDARRLGLFLTPEETSPPPELAGLRARMAALEEDGPNRSAPRRFRPGGRGSGPYVNAIHVSLLREKRQNPAYARALSDLGRGAAGVRRCAKNCWRKARPDCSGRKSCSS